MAIKALNCRIASHKLFGGSASRKQGHSNVYSLVCLAGTHGLHRCYGGKGVCGGGARKVAGDRATSPPPLSLPSLQGNSTDLLPPFADICSQKVRAILWRPSSALEKKDKKGSFSFWPQRVVNGITKPGTRHWKACSPGPAKQAPKVS